MRIGRSLGTGRCLEMSATCGNSTKERPVCGETLTWNEKREAWICPKCGCISKDEDLPREIAVSYVEDTPIDPKEIEE